MKETLEGARFDSLMGGLHSASGRNVNVASDTVIVRGALLAGEGVGEDLTVRLATAADSVDTPLYIAYEDHEPGATVMSVFDSGVFNRSAIVLDESLDINAFEQSLRQQNIRLTEVLE